jgi:CheY-like chemotaxis protein
MARILIIDDDEVFLIMIKGMLENADHEAFLVNDSTKALNNIESFEPDLVVLDIFMPGRDGFELITEIKSVNPLTPVIAVSSGGTHPGETEYLDTIKDLGAEEFIRKPIQKDEFLETLLKLLP